MLQKQIPAALPTPLVNACRGMAYQVLDLLQIQIDDDLPEHVVSQLTRAPRPMSGEMREAISA